jgi:hypothetical protein
MTKKHFEIIALILAETLTDSQVLGVFTPRLDKAVAVLKGTNPRFDAGRFTEAVHDLVSGRRPKGFSTELWGQYETANRI